MNYQVVRTRFETYECLCLSSETQLISNDLPILSKIETVGPTYSPPPYDFRRQSLLDRCYALFPEESFRGYINSFLEERGHEPRTEPFRLDCFESLNEQVHLPEQFRSTWITHLNKDYYIILQIGGLIYDLCRLVRPPDKASIHRIYNYFSDWSFITNFERTILLMITGFYYELTALWTTSTRQFAQLLASQSGVSILDLFWILQAIGISYEGVDFISRLDEVRWYLWLLINKVQIPRQISRNVKTYRISRMYSVTKVGKIRLIPLTKKNITNLINDPVSSFAWPVEFSKSDYVYLTGRSVIDLRNELLEIIMSCVESRSIEIKSARKEIYDWYRKAEMNKLSKNSLDDLILRMIQYPRLGWNSDRIRMTIRRLSSANYELEDFITEYDRDYIEAVKIQRAQIEELIRPFYPISDQIGLNSDQAFCIPLLSPRGLLLFYSITKGRVPVWFDRLIARSLESVVSISKDFHGLYGDRYEIDGLLLPETNRVIMITR